MSTLRKNLMKVHKLVKGDKVSLNINMLPLLYKIYHLEFSEEERASI